MLNFDIILLLALGPIAWMFADMFAQRKLRIIVGLFAFLWVGYWGIAVTSKYMDSEIKGITFAFDSISRLDEEGKKIETSNALSIYREKRYAGES
jgi:hypothetical protein